MRVLVFCCLLVAGALAWPEYLNDHHHDIIYGDSHGPDLAHRQQDVNHLLYHVTEHLKFDDLKNYAETYHPEEHDSDFKDNGKAVHCLIDDMNDHRLLEQKHWFSLFNTRQRQEALKLFKVLMNAKSWSVFVKTAAYFREHMNEGQFVYALYTAVIHSDLGQGIVLPPLYEVTPHMFTDSEIIHKAYTAQMTHTPGKFKMHFTGSQKNPEQRVAYFGEDIGLNVHHVTWHMDFPFWWEDSYGYHLDRKGELFFWAHHQLTARFDAERLSNHLELVDELYWDQPIHEGFAPHTTYRYGGEFPSRADHIHFEDVDGIVRVRDMVIMETRIRDAIAHGYITTKDGSHMNIRDEHGIDHLGDIIESSLYSPNPEYYGSLHNLAHIILGHQADPHGKYNLPPGVMEHFETATRDPAFFRLHKYMDHIFKEHKDSLPPYTKEELVFPGVKIDELHISGELETYFEDYEFSLNMAVDTSEHNEHVEVSAVIPRINHKPFTYDIDISNNNDGDSHGVVRIFLCPRRDASGVLFKVEEGRWHCIEMDKFWVKLQHGTNSIHRKSTDSSITVPDIPSFKKLIHDADAAVSSGSTLDLHEFDRSCGIPNRLLLPKGTHEGMDFALLVAVTDGHEDAQHDALEEAEHHSHAHCGIHGEHYPDHMPMGFPMDRRIPDDRIYRTTENFAYTFVKVFHKEH